MSAQEVVGLAVEAGPLKRRGGVGPSIQRGGRGPRGPSNPALALSLPERLVCSAGRSAGTSR